MKFNGTSISYDIVLLRTWLSSEMFLMASLFQSCGIMVTTMWEEETEDSLSLTMMTG
jgi:hypothetical protein